ncbi:thiol-disulfide oxidoreductase ResA [Robertmurraya yapensis]|uniref:Thiol-disulfide oxidoreductase ResA n=1 Tax=Bacillus yapensis TaxID=2492960 RepID=A0A431W4N1_9BACI|nr:thiol-disulfide oxidoreductase ResA [Bacillus yapensis]RTR30384.1 thiol-disulfide oxidoreductase ResA [Bacillus yapensis]TKS95203.1 thiol-disulfide oxidoreductase ResA [Bacillus yapensis]
MKKQRLIIRTVILLVLGAAVIYTLYANFTKDDNPEIEVGKKAPDFVLTDLNGEKYRLSDFEGKGVLLNFWATWCPPCEREMPYLEQQYQNYNDEGIQVLTVNVGEATVTVKEFIDRHKLTFPVLNDKNQEVLTAYGVDPLPITFLIDKDGIIKKIHKGEIINEAVIADMAKEIKP